MRNDFGEKMNQKLPKNSSNISQIESENEAEIR